MKNPFKKNPEIAKQKAYWNAKAQSELMFNIVSRNNEDVIICDSGYNKMIVSTREDGKDATKLLARLRELRNTYIESKVNNNIK